MATRRLLKLGEKIITTKRLLKPGEQFSESLYSDEKENFTALKPCYLIQFGLEFRPEIQPMNSKTKMFLDEAIIRKLIQVNL